MINKETEEMKQAVETMADRRTVDFNNLKDFRELSVEEILALPLSQIHQYNFPLIHHQGFYDDKSEEWAMQYREVLAGLFWRANEIDMGGDLKDYTGDNMPQKMKDLFFKIMKFFTQADVRVFINYDQIVNNVFRESSVRSCSSLIVENEGRHEEAYAYLLKTLGISDEELKSFIHIPQLKAKDEFLTGIYINTFEDLCIAILANSVLGEGVGLYSSFVPLLFLSSQDFMKGTGQIVEWSVRDECLLKGSLVILKDLSTKKIEDITLDDEIITFDTKTLKISSSKPTKKQHVKRNKIYHFKGRYIDQKVSAGHRMIYLQGGIKECLAEDFVPSDDKYFIALKDINDNKHTLDKSTDVDIHVTDTEEDMDFYCISVPEGAFMVKGNNGMISVTGNSLHVNFTTFMMMQKFLPRIFNEIPKTIVDRIVKMVHELMKVEDGFIDYILGDETFKDSESGKVYLNSALLKEYVRYMADTRFAMAGLPPQFGFFVADEHGSFVLNREHPLPWARDLLDSYEYVNNFEGVAPTEYTNKNFTGNFEDTFRDMKDIMNETNDIAGKWPWEE